MREHARVTHTYIHSFLYIYIYSICFANTVLDLAVPCNAISMVKYNLFLKLVNFEMLFNKISTIIVNALRLLFLFVVVGLCYCFL